VNYFKVHIVIKIYYLIVIKIKMKIIKMIQMMITLAIPNKFIPNKIKKVLSRNILRKKLLVDIITLEENTKNIAKTSKKYLIY
jgi:hypothetical protein